MDLFGFDQIFSDSAVLFVLSTFAIYNITKNI